MASDRKNYVMSVDLALKREMAYRKKTETLTAERCNSTAVVIPQNSLHSQVQSSSTLIPIPRPAPTPRPNPNPYRPAQTPIINPRPAPYVGSTPAQAPPSRPNLHHPGPTLNPIPLIRPPLIRTSRPTYPTHQKKKVAAYHQPKRIKVVSPEDFYCNLCQVDCGSEINLRMHLKGHKHKSMLRNKQAKNVVGGTSDGNDKLNCELCGIWCTDMHAFNLHLNGKNHYLKQRAHEMKMKGPDGSSSVAPN